MKNKDHFLLISLFALSTTVLPGLSTGAPTTFGEKFVQAPSQLAEDCELSLSPLTRCDLFNDFQEADLQLNTMYRALSKTLAADSSAMLRNTQRQWLKFRERKCSDLQEASGCDNSFCDGVEHDHCILELTQIRTFELKFFLKDPGYGKRTGYRYEKNYPRR